MYLFNSSKMDAARKMLRGASGVAVLTGAGISVASGIPTFRGKSGLWSRPEYYHWALRESHDADFKVGWDAFEKARILCDEAGPNAAHRALATFARRTSEKRKVWLFTQNVDSLLAHAGCVGYEIHGSLRNMRCEQCRIVYNAPLRTRLDIVPCASCQGRVRHDVVLFGETVRYVALMHEAFEVADVILLVGTSGMVTDTRAIAKEAHRRGKHVIEVDPAYLTAATFWTTISIHRPAEEVLPLLLG